MKYISQNNSNQNERYSSSGNNFHGINNDEENNIGRIKLKLSKEEMINLIKSDNKRKEKQNMSNYNDSLSRVRNNIISIKDKIKFKDNTLNKINNLFNLSEEEKEDDELDDENNDKNSEDDNNVQNKGNEKINNNKNNKMRNIKKKQMLRKFMRSPSFSILKSKTNHNKGEKNNLNNEENEINKTDSDDFVNIEEVESKYKRKRYNSKDNILLKEKDDVYNQYENENLDNLGLKYISGNNSMNDNFKGNKSKKKNIKFKKIK